MLFEATGDSEIDSDVSRTIITNDDIGTMTSSSSDPEDTQISGLAEDDAFSCSCDNECCDDFHHPTDQDYVYVDDGDEEKDDQDEQGKLMDDLWGCHFHEYHEDEDEDAVDQVRRVNNVLKRIDSDQPGPGGGVGVWMSMMEAEAGRRKKLKVCGKPELISQRDKDRRFWETCLSS